MAGLVTNDSLSVLQRIVHQASPRPTTPHAPFSTLEAQLAERLGPRAERRNERMGGFRRPTRAEYQAAQRRVRQRQEQGGTPVAPAPQSGRWALVHRFGVLGKGLAPAEQIAQQARLLLARHGVVTHASLENEFGAWEWNTIYQELQRLEMRGEVRRGYFVQGLAGVQFALPDAVERLRELAGASHTTSDGARAAPSGNQEPLVVLNACDPANLYGPALGEGHATQSGAPFTFARLPSTWLVLDRGLPLLLVEDSGARLTTIQGVDDGLERRAIDAWLAHVATFEHRVQVTSWNDAPVLNSPGQSLLEAAGFYRDYPGMTWERHQAASRIG
jgi:ATP-dependent Lhr-like helicase